VDFHASRGDVSAEAAANRLSIETAAREMRYAFFRSLLIAPPEGSTRPDKIATGHTLDDRPETVLMRIPARNRTRG